MLLAFTFLITLQFFCILLHDLVEIPSLTHSRQMRAVLGSSRLVTATLINSIFPGVAVVLAWLFWNRPRPPFVDRYWLVYCSVTVLSALAMWYLPYFLGASAQKREQYQRFYANTKQILPARGDNPRPNLLHVGFHLLFAATLSLAVAIHAHGL
jgi:hypothetical protein